MTTEKKKVAANAQSAKRAELERVFNKAFQEIISNESVYRRCKNSGVLTEDEKALMNKFLALLAECAQELPPVSRNQIKSYLERAILGWRKFEKSGALTVFNGSQTGQAESNPSADPTAYMMAVFPGVFFSIYTMAMGEKSLTDDIATLRGRFSHFDPAINGLKQICDGLDAFPEAYWSILDTDLPIADIDRIAMLNREITIEQSKNVVTALQAKGYDARYDTDSRRLFVHNPLKLVARSIPVQKAAADTNSSDTKEIKNTLQVEIRFDYKSKSIVSRYQYKELAALVAKRMAENQALGPQEIPKTMYFGGSSADLLIVRYEDIDAALKTAPKNPSNGTIIIKPQFVPLVENYTDFPGATKSESCKFFSIINQAVGDEKRIKEDVSATLRIIFQHVGLDVPLPLSIEGLFRYHLNDHKLWLVMPNPDKARTICKKISDLGVSVRHVIVQSSHATTPADLTDALILDEPVDIALANKLKRIVASLPLASRQPSPASSSNTPTAVNPTRDTTFSGLAAGFKEAERKKEAAKNKAQKEKAAEIKTSAPSGDSSGQTLTITKFIANLDQAMPTALRGKMVWKQKNDYAISSGVPDKNAVEAYRKQLYETGITVEEVDGISTDATTGKQTITYALKVHYPVAALSTSSTAVVAGSATLSTAVNSTPLPSPAVATKEPINNPTSPASLQPPVAPSGSSVAFPAPATHARSFAATDESKNAAKNVEKPKTC